MSKVSLKNIVYTIKTICCSTILLLSLSLMTLAIWANNTWDSLDFEKIILNLDTGIPTGNLLTFDPLLKYYIYASVLVFLILLYFFNNQTLLKISGLFGLFFIYLIHIIPYCYYQYTTSDLYEKYYKIPTVSAEDFPTRKRNLLLIYLESVERNFANPQLYQKNLLPRLQKLAQTHPHDDNYFSLYGTNYTKGALVAGHCGIPNRSIPKGISPRHQYNMAHCISDILFDHGYETWFAQSADHNFAGTRFFYQNHKYQNIITYENLTEDLTSDEIKLNQSSYNGLSDKLLFTNILQKFNNQIVKEPFLMTVFTIDTHYPGTVLPYNCPRIFGDIRDNISCTDKNVYDFISSFKKTPYWENTTIVILGDHIMFKELKTHHPYSNSSNVPNRGIYNVFLNLPNDKMNIDTHKKFTALDFAPTYLEALGINLKDHALGLGRSLFSDTPSLISLTATDFAQSIKHQSKIFNSLHKKIVNTEYHNYSLGEIITNSSSMNYTPYSDKIINKYFIPDLYLKLPTQPKSDLIMELEFEAMLSLDPQLMINVNTRHLKTVTLEKKIGSHSVQLIIPQKFLTTDKIWIEFFNNNNRSYTSQKIILKKFSLKQK